MGAELTIPVLCLSKRKSMVDNVRNTARGLGVADQNLFSTAKGDEVVQKLRTMEQAIVVLDWDTGVEENLAVLKYVREAFRQDSWLVYLISPKSSEKIIAAGMEFGAAQVHLGEVTPAKLKIILTQLANDAKQTTPLKKVYVGINEARRQGRWREATEILQRVFEQDPKNPKSAVELAENLIVERKWDEAFQVAAKFNDLDPPNPRILHIIGRCLLKQNKLSEACEVLARAKIVNPFNIDRLVELGNAYLNTDQLENALEVFKEAEEIAPNNNEVAKGKGTCQLLEGEINEAMDLLRTRVTGRELASVFNTAAIICIRQGHHDQGMGLYEQAEKVLKDQKDIVSRIYFNRAIGYFRWNKIEDAILFFEKSVGMDPHFTKAQHFLQFVKESASKPGTTPEAMQQMAKGKKLSTELSFSDTPEQEEQAAKPSSLLGADEKF